MTTSKRIGRRSKPDRFAVAMQRRLRLLADRERERRTAAEVAVGIHETVSLSEQRGAEFNRPVHGQGEAPKPPRRITGLEWLISRKPARISAAQMRQGERWGACWRAATGEPVLRSGAISDSPVGGRDDAKLILGEMRDAEARIIAAEKLEEMNLMLLNQPKLLEALTIVCGQEKTPREASTDGHAALRLECLVCVALDMLVEASRLKQRSVAA